MVDKWLGLPAPTPRHRAVHERCCCLATRVHKMQEGRRPLGAEEVEVEDGEQEALAEREEAGDAGLQ
ncbi:unnamed protein product [Boreogadus saida]